MSPDINLLDDIYYNKDYASLYLKPESELFTFQYREGDDFFYNLSIKSPIHEVSGALVRESIYDLETPYGYGGFYTNSNKDDFIKRALDDHTKVCIKEGIIAEFIRFHPFNTFPKKWRESFEFLSQDREVVIVDLSLSQEERWKGYSSNTRNILRRAQRDLTVTHQSTDLDSFQNLYQQTMLKNQADEFYFFEKNYFTQLNEMKNVELLTIHLNDEAIASGFFLYGKEVAHYHLSANSNAHLRLNANYLLLDTMFEKAKACGCKYLMLGGGRTNGENDSLLKFKKKFSPQTLDFFIAGKVYQPEIYTQLNQLWQDRNPEKKIKYFLKYRVSL